MWGWHIARCLGAIKQAKPDRRNYRAVAPVSRGLESTTPLLPVQRLDGLALRLQFTNERDDAKRCGDESFC
jgi:hypothetical protein